MTMGMIFLAGGVIIFIVTILITIFFCTVWEKEKSRVRGIFEKRVLKNRTSNIILLVFFRDEFYV